MIEKLYTVEEVAELASVTGRTIRNYLKSGRLVGRKIGGQWRFPEAEVQRLLTGGVPEEEPEAPAADPAPERDSAPVLKVAPQPAAVEESAHDEDFEAAYEQLQSAPGQQAAPVQAPPRQPTYYNEPAPLPGAAQPPAKPEPPYQPEAAPAVQQPTAPVQQPAPVQHMAQQAAPVPPPVVQSAPVQQAAPVQHMVHPQQPAPQQAAPPPPEYGAPYPAYQQPAQQPQPVYGGPVYGAQPQQPAQQQPPLYGAGQPVQPQTGIPVQCVPQQVPLQQPYPPHDAAFYGQPGYAGPQQPVFVSPAGVLYEAVPVTGYAQPQGAQAPAGQASQSYAAPPATDKPAAPSPAPAEKAPPQQDASAFPHLSDVGNRVTKFISEVHDYSKGPQMCAVVDLHQSFSAARITSQRLADIADEESEAGLLCQSFVEFDERFYVARYTLFGTTSYLLRCLKLIG